MARRKVLGSIVNTAQLVCVGCHFTLVYSLIFIQLCLIDACLRIQPVLIKVTFLVELLIDIRCFHQVTFHEALMNPSSEASSVIPPPCAIIGRCHEPPLIIQFFVLGYECSQIFLICCLAVHHHTLMGSGVLFVLRIGKVSYLLARPFFRLLVVLHLHVVVLLVDALVWQLRIRLHVDLRRQRRVLGRRLWLTRDVTLGSDGDGGLLRV